MRDVTIAEVELKTGLTRANIRFYEKEGLLSPTRGENGYRNYSDEDVRTLEKVKLLRRLRIAVPVIREVQRGERTLADAVQAQVGPLEREWQETDQALAICQAITADGVSFSGLDPARYLSPAMAQGGGQALQNDRLQPAGHPWARYFARAFDLGLYALLLMIVTRWLLRWNTPEGLAASLLFNYAKIGLMLLFEPILLRYWGTTPGKWIFGMKVRGVNGQKLTWADAMGRTLSVFRTGMGYGVPVYQLYRAYVCYSACRERELAWDEENDSVILAPRDRIHPARMVCFVLADVLSFALALGVVLRAELPPHRGELTLAAYTDNCNDYLKYRDLPGRVKNGEWDAWSPDDSTFFIGMESRQRTEAQTDEAGMVRSVTYRFSSADMLSGDALYLRDMLLYAFAVSHERRGALETMLDPVTEQMENFYTGFEADLGSLHISQQVTHTGYEVVGGVYLWPEEGAQAAFEMVFTISKK